MYKRKIATLALSVIFMQVLLWSCNSGSSKNIEVVKSDSWPPKFSIEDNNGISTFKGMDLLRVPDQVLSILDSTDAQLSVAETAPTVELIFHNELRNIPRDSSGALWTSWGDICLASDGKVYSGIGNHWGMDLGETYIYCWDPEERKLKKIVDINEIVEAESGDPRFSKVHAPIFEGSDKKIYFTGTLDNGGLAGVSPNLEAWNSKISGAKLFQYDPKSGKTIVLTDFPPATVTAATAYDPERNIFYCELEGNPKGVYLGVFNMTAKEWSFEGSPGMISHHRDIMMDVNGNIYFNGPKVTLSEQERGQLAEKMERRQRTSMLPISEKHRAIPEAVTALWKYDPSTKSVSETKTSTFGGVRASTRESKSGFIYGTTMNNELFKYSPTTDEMTILGSNFLVDGEYITVCVLSPDEKYMYYLPGAHGSAGFSGTPIIQYNIDENKQKALVFLSETMVEKIGYAPGGTYGIKISDDGSKLYIGLNGAPADSTMHMPKGVRMEQGFGLTSFAIIHIPEKERL